MSNLVGKNIGRYHIVEKLGEGGMASVYKAFDTRLERYVAIKVITTAQQGSEQFLKRFEREAKALAKLTHANIVSVIDYGDEDGLPYLVMEYLPGGTLKQYTGRPLSFRDAARILVPIAWALEYAHQRQIIHRDVKPANILLTESGTPMLSDFGIAKILDTGGATQLTATGAGIGTPDYMSPEQSRGEAVDHRADIYSLGIVFYEMVTGRRPFQADTPMAVIYKHATEPLPRPRQFVPDLPEDVERVIFKALTKSPDDRYQKMGDFAAALENLAYLPDAGEGKVVPAAGAAPGTPPAQSKEFAPRSGNIASRSGELAPQSSGAAGFKFPASTAAAPQETRTTTSPSQPGRGTGEEGSAQQPKKFPWVWVGVGAGGLVILCIVIAAVAGLWKPLSALLFGEATPTAVAIQNTKTPPSPVNTRTPQGPPQGMDMDCSQEAVVCVGAMGSGPWDDQSFHQSVQEGMAIAEKELGILPKFYTVPNDADPNAILQKMVDDGMDIIISAGFEYTDAVLVFAREHPGVQVIGIDQLYAEEAPANLVGVNYHEDQAGFLAGALAGMMTQTNSVGAVCGLDWIPAVWRYCEGFRAGVLYVNADAAVDIRYYPGGIDSAFTDPDWGAAMAKEMIVGEKADVLFSAAGATSNGVHQLALELNVYAIGVDVDQYYTVSQEVQKVLLSSAAKDITGSVVKLITLSMKNNFPSGTWYGEVSLAPYHDLEQAVPQGVKDKILILTEQLASGQIQTNVPESKDAQNMPVYRIATNPDWPPFELIDDSGKLAGFDIELMLKIAKDQNIQVEFVQTAFDDVINGVSTCQYNGAISGLNYSSDRAEVMLFSDPYFNDGQIVLVRKDETAFQNKDDLAGKRIAVWVGSTGQVEAEKIPNTVVLSFDVLDAVYEALVSGNADAAILYRSTVARFIRENPGQVKTVGEVFTDESLYLVACKDNQDLIKIFNTGLANMHADGTYNKLLKTWLAEGQ